MNVNERHGGPQVGVKFPATAQGGWRIWLASNCGVTFGGGVNRAHLDLQTLPKSSFAGWKAGDRMGSYVESGNLAEGVKWLSGGRRARVVCATVSFRRGKPHFTVNQAVTHHSP